MIINETSRQAPNYNNAIFIFTTAQSHNTPLLPPPPPPKKKNLHNHCLQVLLGHEDVLREIKNNTYAKFWRVKEVYYGICASSELRKIHKNDQTRFTVAKSEILK